MGPLYPISGTNASMASPKIAPLDKDY